MTMQVFILEQWDYYDGFLLGLVEIDGKRYRAQLHSDVQAYRDTDEVWRYEYYQTDALTSEGPVGEFMETDLVRTKEKTT